MEIALTKNSRGQASITDAIFILIIVSVLSVLMFDLSVNYGRQIDAGLNDFYNEDFTTSALQTLLNSSAPRFPGEALESAQEVDYLLAMMKEDYASSASFDEETKLLIKNTLDVIMSSRESSYDYLFYIWTPQSYTSASGSGTSVGNPQEGFIFVYLRITDIDEASGTVEKKSYFCEPSLSLRKIIYEVLLGSVNSPIKAQPVIMVFPKIVVTPSGDIEEEEIVSYAGLIMWQSAGIPKGLNDESILSENNLNCTEIS